MLALQRGLRDDAAGDAMAQNVVVVLCGILRYSQLLGRRTDRSRGRAGQAERSGGSGQSITYQLS